MEGEGKQPAGGVWHQPVLVEETLDLLAVRSDGIYVDGTLGSGGHSLRILERLGPDGLLLGVDRDPAAVERSRARLSPYSDRCRLVHGNFSDLRALAQRNGVEAADGVLLDLGVSSEQLAVAERGFSLMRDGPLDMRMDPTGDVTAADIVNGWAPAELERILIAYGEERQARRIVRRIVEVRRRRPLTTTLQLAELVADAKGGRQGKIHPATQVFQALRMAVNREAECLARGLESGLALLKPGGRMAVIAFHSVEDRAVKQCFKAHAGFNESLPGGGVRRRVVAPEVRGVTRKPVIPGEGERAGNPRARSAKLRVAERTAA